MPALRDQVDAALAAAQADRLGRAPGRSARATSTTSGSRADMEVDGRPGLQQAVRFALFQVVQAAARAEQRAIPAKGLTGRGYDGHTFWDMDTYTPAGADLHRAGRRARRAALAPLDARPGAGAGARAAAGGRGVPVADDSRRGVLRATGRPARPRSTSTPTSPTRFAATSPRPAIPSSSAGPGVELLVETARLWRSLGHHDAEGASASTA